MFSDERVGINSKNGDINKLVIRYGVSKTIQTI